MAQWNLNKKTPKENNSGKLQIISMKFQNCGKFQNNATNDVKQISLCHVINYYYKNNYKKSQ